MFFFSVFLLASLHFDAKLFRENTSIFFGCAQKSREKINTLRDFTLKIWNTEEKKNIQRTNEHQIQFVTVRLFKYQLELKAFHCTANLMFTGDSKIIIKTPTFVNSWYVSNGFKIRTVLRKIRVTNTHTHTEKEKMHVVSLAATIRMTSNAIFQLKRITATV